jgi:hypothetical protein
MQAMKTNGYAEISAALARVRRLRAAGRVTREDACFIEDSLEAVQARIQSMEEYDQHGDPIAG